MGGTPLARGSRISFGQKNSPDDETALLLCASLTNKGESCVTPKEDQTCALKLSSLQPQTKPIHHGEDRQGGGRSGQVISFIGVIGVAVTTGIPMWRVTTFVGANIVTGQNIWDGLWMRCVMQSTGQMQCSLNESVMSLATDLQAARALVIISLIFGFIGVMLTFVGVKCTSCLDKDSSKAKVVIISGCLILVCAVLVLIPVTWSAAITIGDFQNPLTIDTQRRELGAAIYIGWASTAILLIGGITLTTSCPPQKAMYGYPGYPPAPMYPYAGPGANPAGYGPVYAPASSQPYTGSGTYITSKPYTVPTAYSPRQYL